MEERFMREAIRLAQKAKKRGEVPIGAVVVYQDIPFFFHNTDKVFICNVPGVSDQLEEKMAMSFVSFARTGVPAAEGLPQ